MKHDVTVELAAGKQIKFETGRMAKQASGAAFTTSGDNAILATAVASPDPKEGIAFFPLTVEYREFAYAGGRIAAHSFPRPSATRPRSSLSSIRPTRRMIRTFSESMARAVPWRSPISPFTAQSAPCGSA